MLNPTPAGSGLLAATDAGNPHSERSARSTYVPRATYRVQLTPSFGFAALEAAVPYLDRLGVSHLYLSPVFRTRPGSQHGYDITDHSQLNPELGSLEQFRSLAATCSARGMGLVLDIVPNHMAVMTAANGWWTDVLENGPASKYAAFFDIDWTPARTSMRNRLLVPVLGVPLGDVINQGDIRLHFDAAAGSFHACYGDYRLPLDPREYPRLFASPGASDAFPGDDTARQDFSSLLDAFSALPPALAASPEVVELRDRDKEVNKRRLARLCERHPAVAGYIEDRLRALNDIRSETDAEFIAGLLGAQPYRLAYWRVSGEEINYRRFFDVNDLAALRMEDPAVFNATHALLRELWRDGFIEGVRVDHADGLHDPARYFAHLAEALDNNGNTPAPYIVVEKILGTGERLPPDWNIGGTTGYEFGALVTGWLMNSEGALLLERIYRRFTGSPADYAEIVYQSKKRVMQTSLAAEISVLATKLDRVAQLHRNTADFTLFDLRQAIVEVIACFPVYRTYIAGAHIRPEDSQVITRALGAARSRKQIARRALEFLGSVLLGETAETPERQAASLGFTLKFQQVTGPVMAKGVEDTGFYRYPCLLAMNEVGGDPLCRGIATEALHKANEARAHDWPHSLLATSTHDSKRGEDCRYRLAVLSEIPQLWQACLGRWRRLKRRGRAGALATPEHEYLLLQAALGIWPASSAGIDVAALSARLKEYAVKAAREAKDVTSWLDPDPDYEETLRQYVDLLLPGSGPAGFPRYFQAVIERAARFGMLNSLSATVFKFTAPGVPDVYQGNELPQFVLVDPDNRRQVDLQAHGQALQAVEDLVARMGLATAAAALLAQWHDGIIKLFVSARLLELRRAEEVLFAEGAYAAMPALGTHRDHVAAYARSLAGRSVLVIVSRWAATLCADGTDAPLGMGIWGDTCIELPPGVAGGRYTDIFTGRSLLIPAAAEPRVLPVGEQFDILPVSVLVAGGKE